MRKLFYRQLHKDNRGLTLIEVIVSLLILTIVVVPVFTVFSSGQRSAFTSRKLSFAERVAENEMEEIKALGIKDYTAYKSIDLDDAAAVQTYFGTITGIVEGNHTYSANVTITEDSALNTIEYVDLTEFSSATTGLINPNVSDEIQYDDRALNRFLELNNDYWDDVWDKICSIIDDQNGDMMELDPDYVPMPMPQRIPGLTESQIEPEISREMKVDIFPTGTPQVAQNGETVQMYRVESSMKYTIRNNENDSLTSGDAYVKITRIKSTYWAVFEASEYQSIWGHDSIAQNRKREAKAILDNLGVVCDKNDPKRETRTTRSYSYYAHNLALTNVKTVYMIYEPLFADSFANPSWTFKSSNREKITMSARDLKEDVKCYIVVQSDASTNFNSVGELNVSISNTTNATYPGVLKVASQAPIRIDGDNSQAGEDLSTLYTTERRKVIYKVKVEVYDSDGGLSATLESTVVEE